MKARVILEDGRVFKGILFGDVSKKTSAGEVVFNTSMSGYQEILTDPSYKGQIVTMTYPHIGNYGINHEDNESGKVCLEGFIVRELCSLPSNYRAKMTLDEYFKEQGILGITGVDTRALTRHIRLSGSMKGIIVSHEAEVVSGDDARGIPGLTGKDTVKLVTSRKIYNWNEKGDLHVVVIDCGVKHSILRALAVRGLKVTVVPADTNVGEIRNLKPDGVLVSNGPGDPEGVPYARDTVRDLLGTIPVFGICLGHQIIGLALGAETYKLKFGHHGGNHPVKDIRTGKVMITSQNHCFCVNHDTLSDASVEITHKNLNDGTVEGMESPELRFFSVQFHPEAGPGPFDADHLFDKFRDTIAGNAKP